MQKSQSYDSPDYQVHQLIGSGEAGGAANTAYAKFAVFAASQLFSAQVTVTTAGTATANQFNLVRISGTATTTLGSAVVGTSAAGTTFNIFALGTNTAQIGGQALNQGDIVEIQSSADTVGKVAVGYEVMVAPLANITA